MIRQCAILVGGLGTRLGELTAATPKPLLPVGERPFLAILLEEAARYGFTDIILLAGYKAEQLLEKFAGEHRIAGRTVNIRVSVEATPLGTGGALRQIAEIADEEFLLLNGDSWFDIDLRAFAAAPLPGDCLGRAALCNISDSGRYGTVDLRGDRIAVFNSRGEAGKSALINAGVYLFRRKLLDLVKTLPCSLERDILPDLAARSLLQGLPQKGFFIDIGIPSDYYAAPKLIATHRRRPAVFLDRDNTLNEDKGYTHRPEDLVWLEGAREAVAKVNAAGWYCFVVTNQAGLARAYYSVSDMDAFHAQMDLELAEMGAHIDEYRASPYHPEAAIEAWRHPDAPCRKPNPGMLTDLMAVWPIDLERSFLVGDQATDVEAAKAAGVAGYLADDETLDAVIERELSARR